MNFQDASELMAGANGINQRLNKVAELAELVQDEALRKQIKQQLALAIGEVYIGVVASVLREHPQLDPDQTVVR